MNLFFEKLVVGVTAGDNKWDSTVTDTTKSPHCNVGDWDNGNFDDFLDGLLSLGADSSIPVRFNNPFLFHILEKNSWY